MKYTTLIIGILLLSVSACTNRHTRKDSGMDIYLLIGQSNMAGRAEINEECMDTLEGVYLLSNDTVNPWEEAANPLNKYSQNINEVAASTYIIDTKKFSQKNFQKLDDAFRYVPGVTMTLDQISIRGSSGYSRGAGTRVLVTLDGIPIYAPDSGEIVWELVPVSEIGRVEVIKGSASSLYGSSALGGVINIISKEFTSNPITFMKLQGGFYSKPSHKEWEWTNKTLYYNSQTISHSRSFGKLGVSASISRLEDLSYRQNEDQLRYSGYLRANYNFSEFTTLSFLGAGFTRERSTFVFWQDLQKA